MKAIPLDPGRIVLSKQGHDKGKWFIVVGRADDKHVLIADGQTRKIDKPKKKQEKHLRARPARPAEIARALEAGKAVQNSELRKALKSFQDEEANKDFMGCQKKEECALVQE